MKKKEITSQYIILKQANESKIKILEDLLNSCNELNFQLNVLYEKKCDLDEKRRKSEEEKNKIKDKFSEYELIFELFWVYIFPLILVSPSER